MQNWLVKTILLILTVSSLDTYAANKCLQLFVEKQVGAAAQLQSDLSDYKELQDMAASISTQ